MCLIIFLKLIIVVHWNFLLIHKTQAAVDQTVSCGLCCPYLFRSNQGVISVRESSPVAHTISYILRCFLSTEEIIIVSDGAMKRAYWLNWNRYKNDEARKRVCAYVENVPVTYISTEDFLLSSVEYFLQLVPTYPPDRVINSSEGQPPRRTNFIFVAESDEEMISLLEKVSGAIQVLRTARNYFWQPYFVFLWSHVLNLIPIQASESSPCRESPGQNQVRAWLDSVSPNFTLDSGVFFFFMVQRGSSVRSRFNLHLSLWEIYKLKGQQQLVVQEVTESELLQPPPLEPEPKNVTCRNTTRSANPQVLWMEQINYYFLLTRFSRRTNFKLVLIKASTEERNDSEAFIRVTKAADGNLELKDGAAVSIIEDLKAMLNFSIYTIFGDGVAIQRNYIASGQDSADILLDQKSLNPMRQKFYNFLQPTYHGLYNAFFVQPKSDSIRNIVSAPFTIGLWVIVITTWFALIGCLYGWGYVSKRYSTELREDGALMEEVGLWAVAAMSQKSWPSSPSSLNFKAIFLIVYLMAYICYVAYSAVIVSFLTVKLFPVKSVKDLIDNQYQLTAHNESEATIKLVNTIMEPFNLPPKVVTINTENEITHLLTVNRKRALIAYPDLFYITANNQGYSQRFICTTFDFFPVGNTLYKSAMSVKKASQYKEIFSVKLLTIMERGLNNRYMKTYELSKDILCPKKTYDNTKRQVDPVQITDVFTTYIVVFIGWVAALSVFFTERIYKRRRTIYDLIFITY